MIACLFEQEFECLALFGVSEIYIRGLMCLGIENVCLEVGALVLGHGTGNRFDTGGGGLEGWRGGDLGTFGRFGSK